MEKIKAAIVGYGNIGKAAFYALDTAPDFELAGVVSRSLKGRSAPELAGVDIADHIARLGVRPDVAIVCLPSREVPDAVEVCLENGVHATDAFDIHAQIVPTRARLDAAAKAAGRVSVLAAGWDPGLDSIVRALMEAGAPRGITYTNFGPGMSMGHSVAARAIPGVKAALSMTMPLGASVHRRMVYVELEPGADFDQVAQALKADAYFAHDDTRVMPVDDVASLIDMGHGAHITRKGASGNAHNQRFEFTMGIDNPALTAQMLVCTARAATRRSPGCYTMIELPVIDLLPGGRDGIIARLV